MMQTRRFAFIIPEFHQPSSRSRKEVPRQRLLPAFEESLCFQVSQVLREGVEFERGSGRAMGRPRSVITSCVIIQPSAYIDSEKEPSRPL